MNYTVQLNPGDCIIHPDGTVTHVQEPGEYEIEETATVRFFGEGVVQAPPTGWEVKTGKWGESE